MAKLFDRVAVSTVTTGTGTVTLGSASGGLWLTPDDAGVQDGDVVSYVITEGSDFELGRGTYTASGATLSRDTVLKSKIGGVVGTAKMDLQGEATVAFTAAAGDMPESGSNADGRYVRFPDGTQICTHAMKAEYLSADRLQGEWTFPAAFSGAADYSWSAMPQVRDPDNTVDGINLAKMHNTAVYEASHSNTKLFFRVGSEDSLFVSGDYVWLSLTATARLPGRVADFR